MKQIKNTLLLYAVIFIFQSYNAYSACLCNDGILYNICFNDLIIVPGSVMTRTYTNNLVSAGPFETGSCPSPGARPKKQTCAAIGQTKKVNKWEVSGAINFKYFGVDGNLGGEVETAAGCENTATELTDWCQCCANAAGLVFTETTMKGICSCQIINLWTIPNYPQCSQKKEGTITRYQGVACFPIPCTVEPNCKPCAG